MSSNKLIYDECAYKKKLQESTSPLEYSLYKGKFENCAKCRVEFGTVGGNGVSLPTVNLVDLESELRGQFRKTSSCPSKKYTPSSTPNDGSTGLKNSSFESIKNKFKHQPSCQMHYYPKVPIMDLPKPYGC